MRLLYADMDELSIDKNGRAMITSEIRERCGIKGECIVNGLRNHFEIWPAAVWGGQKATDDRKAELYQKFAGKIR